MLRPLIRSATAGPDVYGNVIGVLHQLDFRRRCWKVGQIVIEDYRRRSSSLYHSCFHFSAPRFLLPKMNFVLSILHIVVAPATECCRNVGVVDTIEQLLMVHIVEFSRQIENDEYCCYCAGFLPEKPAAMSEVIVDSAVHVESFGGWPSCAGQKGMCVSSEHIGHVVRMSVSGYRG